MLPLFDGMRGGPGSWKKIIPPEKQHGNGKFTFADVFPIQNGDFPLPC